MVRIISASVMGDCVPPSEYADGVPYHNSEERTKHERRSRRRRLESTGPPPVPRVRPGRSLLRRNGKCNH